MRNVHKAIATGVVLAVVAIGAGAWAAYQAAVQRPDLPMARLMPQGAVLFLEAKDFGGLLREWNASPQKQAWLRSDNYEVFSRSRLFLRLEQVQGEFAAAAGVPPNMNFLSEVAGERSALGIYDIGKVELLYITRLPSARFMQSALWQKRAQFEPRQAVGQQFFVRTEPQSGRVVAFALAGDYLLLATREDLIAGALTVVSGQKLTTAADEPWFANAIKAGKESGDLRMLINLAKVAHTPQFRTYWAQRNITDVQQYEAVLTDLYRSTTEYREERVLFRLPSAESSASVCGTGSGEDIAHAVADVVRFLPAEAGTYRASAVPSVDNLLSALERRLLTPRFGPTQPVKQAPNVSLGGGAVGNESDLETRIDTPPAARPNDSAANELLRTVLTKANVRALLEVHRSEAAPDGVFVKLRSTMLLSAGSDWDENAVRGALQRLVSPTLTTSDLGTGWTQAGTAPENYFQLDGLKELLVTVRGKYLFVGNDPAMLTAALRRMRQPAAEPACYVAGFNHGRERQEFYHLTGLVDQPNRTSEGSTREPEFFSSNVASLSRTLAGVESQSIVIRGSGSQEVQTVRYRWSQ